MSTLSQSRRLTRLRKEYIYRRSVEGREKSRHEKKAAITRALQDGKRIPTELRGEDRDLRKEAEYDDAGTSVKPRSYMDDEYALAGVRDPKVCITTSRDPSSRLKQFAKEIRLVIPNSVRVNRGATKVEELVSSSRKSEFSDLIVLQETRGDPDGLIVCHLPLGPTAYFSLSDCVLRHDLNGMGTMSEAYPHVILNNFTTPLGNRVGDVLRCLFPVPKDDSKRIMTFSNEDDYISFRHHVYEKKGGAKDLTLMEIGPRLEMQLYQIKLGTLDMAEADDEFALMPYLNSAKSRRLL